MEGTGGLIGRLRAFALSALLVVSQVLDLLGTALAPVSAYAATPVPGSVTVADVEAYSSGTGMTPSHRFVDANGVVTYCADEALATPRVGQTFSGRPASPQEPPTSPSSSTPPPSGQEARRLREAL